jgi:hypothetical protein
MTIMAMQDADRENPAHRRGACSAASLRTLGEDRQFLCSDQAGADAAPHTAAGVGADCPCAWWITSPLGTPRGRYDEYSS